MSAGGAGFDPAVLCVVVGGLLFGVAWIGWRYFVISPVVVPPAKPDQVAPVAPVFPKAARQWRNTLSTPLRAFRLLVLALAVGGGGVLGVFALSGSIALEPLAVLEWGRQSHIQGALNPERLVPPPPFPPSMFVGSGRQGLESADRDWSKLDVRFTQSALLMLERLAARGYVFALLEGFRSPERQDMLADQGAHVTGARAFQSKHQYGLAGDFAPVRDGRLVISERDPWAMQAYVALGEEAERAGLVWGGRWWFKDYGHIEVAAR